MMDMKVMNRKRGGIIETKNKGEARWLSIERQPLVSRKPQIQRQIHNL